MHARYTDDEVNELARKLFGSPLANPVLLKWDENKRDYVSAGLPPEPKWESEVKRIYRAYDAEERHVNRMWNLVSGLLVLSGFLFFIAAILRAVA